MVWVWGAGSGGHLSSTIPPPAGGRTRLPIGQWSANLECATLGAGTGAFNAVRVTSHRFVTLHGSPGDFFARGNPPCSTRIERVSSFDVTHRPADSS
jgi:hypothetical protein